MSGRTYNSNAVQVMKKRETETWIYSYADLITNLMALFVMMLIITMGSSQVKAKFKAGLDEFVKGKNPATGHVGDGAHQLDDLRQMIADYLNKLGLVGRVGLVKTETGIELTFESALLFESGTATLNEDAQALLGHVGELLAGLPPKFILDVEGHADNRPVSSGRYPSNWELSSARAGSVVRYLETKGIASTRMRAVGYAATHPLDGTGDGEENRRVVIRVNAEGGR